MGMKSGWRATKKTTSEQGEAYLPKVPRMVTRAFA